MKKIMILGLCFVMAMAVSIPVFAAAVQKTVAINTDKGEIQTEAQAIMKDNHCLVEASVIKEHIYSSVKIDRASGNMQMNFGMPRFSLAEKKLQDEYNGELAMQLPLQKVNNKEYIDLAIAGKMFGFTWKEAADKLVIIPVQYTSFAPQVLESEKKVSLIKQSKKLSLVWQPGVGEADITKQPANAAVNVVSPSWFEITNEKGMIENKAKQRYVDDAHRLGYQVWPLITNSFSPKLTRAVLDNEQARHQVIYQLINYLRIYNVDGLNIDFENIYDDDKAKLSAFVGEIAAAMNTMQLPVSMDVTIPTDTPQWSACYDRRALAEKLDYIMLMAYDEHGRLSPRSGSVASIGWVERGIQKTLLEVPAAKLVLGVPFYMREWEEDAATGKKTGVKTMTMGGAEKAIKDFQLKPLWLPEKGQYYFEYQKPGVDGKKYRVWQEEERSISQKTDLIDKYQLAGIAAWRTGFELPPIWTVIGEKLNPEIKQPADEMLENKAVNTDKKDRKQKKHKKAKTNKNK